MPVRLRSVLSFSLTLLMIAFSVYTVFAQESSPSPTPAASPSPSPSATPSSSSPSPSASPATGQATASANTEKQKVLGAATELGSTSRGLQIAKWLLAAGIGAAVFLLGIKMLRSDGQE